MRSSVGLNHPYLYSQYPIDFPSATSHAYSVSGVNPQFGPPEMYSPTGLGSHPHSHELLQPNDVSAQQSQQAPTLLVNSTRAAERWDGKSKLIKFLEPIIGSIKSFVDPIANVFYSMPASFRGLNSDVSTTKSYEPETTEASVKKTREILVPQPRFIAQRKMTLRKNVRTRPKKYVELKVNLDRLKQNKDLHEYLKTKKYKYNYPLTYYYPRVQYFVNPNTFMRRNYTRLIPYKIQSISTNNSIPNDILKTESNEWKPIVVLSSPLVSSINVTSNKKNNFNFSKLHKSSYVKTKSRTRRSIGINRHYVNFRNVSIVDGRSYRKQSKRGFMEIFDSLLESDLVTTLAQKVKRYAKSVLKESAVSDDPPPQYVGVVYKIFYWGLEMIDEFFTMEEEVHDQIGFKSKNATTFDKMDSVKKSKSKVKRKNDGTHSNVEELSSPTAFFWWW